MEQHLRCGIMLERGNSCQELDGEMRAKRLGCAPSVHSQLHVMMTRRCGVRVLGNYSFSHMKLSNCNVAVLTTLTDRSGPSDGV